MSIIVCRPKSLPLDKLVAAERCAVEVNPENASERRIVARSHIGGRGGPRRIAVVIARLDSPQEMAGYWSYIGTEILDAEEDEPTLNLEGFTMRVSDAEFRRVVPQKTEA